MIRKYRYFILMFICILFLRCDFKKEIDINHLLSYLYEDPICVNLYSGSIDCIELNDTLKKVYVNKSFTDIDDLSILFSLEKDNDFNVFSDSLVKIRKNIDCYVGKPIKEFNKFHNFSNQKKADIEIFFTYIGVFDGYDYVVLYLSVKDNVNWYIKFKLKNNVIIKKEMTLIGG